MTRHAFDPIAFVFGALFASVAAAGLTGPWDLRAIDLAWMGPALLVLVGLAVLLTARPTPRPAAEDGPDGDVDDDGPAQGGAASPR